MAGPGSPTGPRPLTVGEDARGLSTSRWPASAPGAARAAVAVGDVAQAPADLRGRVGLPVGAGAGHLRAGQRLRDAVRRWRSGWRRSGSQPLSFSHSESRQLNSLAAKPNCGSIAWAIALGSPLARSWLCATWPPEREARIITSRLAGTSAARLAEREALATRWVSSWVTSVAPMPCGSAAARTAAARSSSAPALRHRSQRRHRRRRRRRRARRRSRRGAAGGRGGWAGWSGESIRKSTRRLHSSAGCRSVRVRSLSGTGAPVHRLDHPRRPHPGHSSKSRRRDLGRITVLAGG